MTNALQIEVEKEWSPNHIQLGWKRVRIKWNIIPVHSSFIRQLPFLWNDHVGWCRIWVLHLLYFPRRLMCKHTRRWRNIEIRQLRLCFADCAWKKGLRGCRLWGGLCCRPYYLTPKTFFMHSSSPSCMFRTCTTCQRRRMCVAGIRESSLSSKIPQKRNSKTTLSPNKLIPAWVREWHVNAPPSHSTRIYLPGCAHCATTTC